MKPLPARVREAQKEWSSLPVRNRLGVVREVRRRIVRQAVDLASRVRFPQRASVAETLASEVIPLADACRFLERKAEAVLRPRALGRRGLPLWLTGTETTIYREPLGVVLIVGPSNYPLFLPGVQTLQALVAGNCVLIKPGRGGRDAAQALGTMLREAGVCDHGVTVLDESEEAVEAAVEAGVDKVLLTGSADSGRAVLRRLATGITPAVMELSGSDAVFVCEDADLDLVVKALRFGLALNAGASCIAPRRVFVARSLAAALERRLVPVIGSDPRFPVTLPPKIAERATEVVEEALREGARQAAGELPREGRMGPLVVADATVEMRLLQEDIMAPLLALVPVDSVDRALGPAGRCPYALGAAVFGSPGRAIALAERIDAGVVVVNDIIIPTADSRAPFGGRKRSGFGDTRGEEGLLELTRSKAVAVRKWGAGYYHLDPFDSNDQKLFSAYINAVHGDLLFERGLAMVGLLREMARKWRAANR